MISLHLKRGREKRIRNGHCWAFAGEIQENLKGIPPGEGVTLCESRGKVLGRGYVNPHSLIAVRLITKGTEPFDESTFERRIATALKIRQIVCKDQSAYRLIFSEADGIPGLIVDRYLDHLVIQSLTQGIEIRLDQISQALEKIFNPKSIFLKANNRHRVLEGLTDEDVDIPMFSKNEADKILNSLIEDVINQRGTYRKDLGDFYHIGVNQYMNYFLMALSEGHAILSKHSGFLCGERIAEKANLSDQESALDYACDLFLYLKAGILHEPEVEGNHIIMRMDESVFASGVSNINMKLDVFLTGIIEGMLNKATDEKWQVEETKCIANGDDYCEFRCRQV